MVLKQMKYHWRNFKVMTADERKKMGERGLSFYQQQLALDKGIDHFLRVFESVISR